MTRAELVDEVKAALEDHDLDAAGSRYARQIDAAARHVITVITAAVAAGVDLRDLDDDEQGS